MRVAVLSGKGGAGKTFVAVNLAAVAGTARYVDCDVEEPNGHIFFRPEGCRDEPVLPAAPAGFPFTETSRKPQKPLPNRRAQDSSPASAAMARSSSCTQAWREASSLGRKIMPTPYSPGGGSCTPWRAISAR